MIAGRCVAGLVALGADRRGGLGLESAMILVAVVVSATQVAALLGTTLDQGFAPVQAALAAFGGG